MDKLRENCSVIPQYIAALTAAIGALITGLSLGWSSPVQSRLTDDREYGFAVTDSNYKWIGSLLALGAATQCIIMGYSVNRFGPKMMAFLISFPCIIGWLLLICASNVGMLYAGRFIIGMTSAAFCVAIPLYIGDISRKEIRGRLGALFQLNITIGILLVYLIGWVVNAQTLTIFCIIVSLIFPISFYFMPESPLFLVERSRFPEAKKSYYWLEGKCSPEVSSVEKKNLNFFQLFKELKRKECVKSMMISVILMCFQQLCGINAVIFYVDKMFKDAKINISSLLASVIVGVVQVIATSVALVSLDRFGRKISFLVSTLFMGLSTTVLGWYFFQQSKDESSVESYNFVPIICLNVYIIAFSFGAGPTPWVILGEIFPTDVKGVAASVAATINWLLAFIVSLSYVPLVNEIGTGATFWIFSFISYLGVIYSAFFMIETKNKTLEEIQNELKGT